MSMGSRVTTSSALLLIMLVQLKERFADDTYTLCIALGSGSFRQRAAEFFIESRLYVKTDEHGLWTILKFVARKPRSIDNASGIISAPAVATRQRSYLI